jgi:hypothetical protein
MSKEELAFDAAGNSIAGAEAGQMFGKRCYKFEGKPIVSFFNNCMVFKLSGEAHSDALSLDGAQLFDPAGNGRAMKEWVQVPYSQVEYWPKLANHALAYFKSKK